VGCKQSRELGTINKGRQAVLFLLLVSAGLAFSCACTGKASDAEENSPGKTAAGTDMPSAGQEKILGGWQAIEPDSENVLAARDFLDDYLAAGNTVINEVTEASQQVVAGFKVRLVCLTDDGKKLCAVVLLRADGIKELSEIDYGCSGDLYTE